MFQIFQIHHQSFFFIGFSFVILLLKRSDWKIQCNKDLPLLICGLTRTKEAPLPRNRTQKKGSFPSSNRSLTLGPIHVTKVKMSLADRSISENNSSRR